MYIRCLNIHIYKFKDITYIQLYIQYTNVYKRVFRTDKFPNRPLDTITEIHTYCINIFINSTLSGTFDYRIIAFGPN